MTTDTTTADDLHAALDLDPSDTLTRSALADWLEENGRGEEAEGQRWLVRVGYFPSTFTLPDQTWWDWWTCSPTFPHANLGAHYMEYAERSAGRFTSRQGAEADAIRWARAAGLIGGAS